MSIKQIVRDGNMAEFEYYRDGELWYRVLYTDDSLAPAEFSFPVPISDIDKATFGRVEKALLLMRWIRRHMKTVEEGKAQANGL